MKTIYILVILIVVGTKGQGQFQFKGVSANRITVNNSDETITAFVRQDETKTSCSPDRYYSWYSAGHIYSTQGGYSGKLLDGEYTARYPNKNLKEKGTYSKGLKEGKWMLWNESGTLKEVVNYNSGIKDGSFSEYNELGKLVRSGTYKKGLLHGNIISWSSGKDSTTVHFYKNGVTARRKKIVIKAEKLMPGFLRGKKQDEKEGKTDK